MRRRTVGTPFRPEVELLESRELPSVTGRRSTGLPPVKAAVAAVVKPVPPPKAPVVAAKVTAAPKPVAAPAVKVTAAPKPVAAPAVKVTAAPKPTAAPLVKTASVAVITPLSDVPNTPALSARPGADVTDTYLFPAADNPNNVVVVMDVHPFIPPGDGPQEEFDPNVLYEMKFSTQDNGQEDTVIQLKFSGPDPATQQVQVSGPVAPEPGRAGTSSFFEQPDPVTGTINQTFTTSNGLKVFAGVREDPFFMDLNQLFTILPDRANPLGPTVTNTNGQVVSTTPADPDQLMAGSWRPQQQAQDFYKNLNVLSIAVELPRSMLGGGIIQYWATTSDDAGMSIQDPAYGHHDNHPGVCQSIYTQFDRVGKPLVNELFAPVNLTVLTGDPFRPTDTAELHQINDTSTPADDVRGAPISTGGVPQNLSGDVLLFMTHAAGRSLAIARAAAALLTPSALVADLSQSGPAGYLGVETHGAIGSLFGGRALTDDVVDTTLGIAFGNTIPSLGLAPDDGAEIPTLTSDNVTQNTAPKHFQNVFPFLGPAD